MGHLPTLEWGISYAPHCPLPSRPRSNSWVGKIQWRRDRLPTPVFLGLPGGSTGKESACNVGDLGLIPGLGRSPGEGKDYPLQCSGLKNSMDCVVYGVTKSWTQLINSLTCPNPQLGNTEDRVQSGAGQPACCLHP